MAKEGFVSIFAAVILIAFVGCGILKSKPAPLTSELADPSVVAPFVPIKLVLNGDGAGTTADLTELRERIKNISYLRTENGVFKEGSNAIVNDVYLQLDPDVPARIFAAVALAINEGGGETHIPLPAASSKDPRTEGGHGNPLTLVVENAAKAYEGSYLTRIDPGDPRFSVAPTFEITDDKITVLLARVSTGSIEVSTNGEYFINDPASLDKAKDAADVKIVQRRVDAAAINAEAQKLLSASENRKELTVVVSASARTDSLITLFSSLQNLRAAWHVVIRQPTKEKS